MTADDIEILTPLVRNIKRCGSALSTISNSSLLQDLRTRISQDKLCKKFNAEDVARITQDDWWLMIFLTSCHYDPDVAYSVVMECLKWRTNFQIEHLSILELKPYLEQQLVYIHGQDHMNNALLWVNSVLLNEANKTVEQLLIFWLDNYFMGTKADSHISIIIDLSGTKVKHIDINVMKFILRVCKYYYPGLVQDVLVYESPSILNAPWRVVKSWIEPGHPALHLINRDCIYDFIDPQYLKPHQGGTDNFVFTMSDIANCLPNPLSPISQNENLNGFREIEIQKPNLDEYPTRRRSVKFDEDSGRAIPLTLPRRPSKGPGRRNGFPSAMKPIIEKRINANENEWLTTPIVSISPKDELALSKIETETDYVDVIIVRNNTEEGLQFKIKTTAPEKFRVRPSTGFIKAKSSEIVRVHLQNEYKYSAAKEKILFLTMKTNETNLEQFSELWKVTSAEDKVENKLKCKVYDDSEDIANGKPERRSSLLSNQQETIDKLNDTVRSMAKAQQIFIVAMCLLFALLVIIIMYENSNYSDLRARIETMSKTLIFQHQGGAEQVKQHHSDEDL